ncbi:MAG TPA: hypothetical protein VGR37_22770 [Longimicrobiaceae bacterium]|nr:hypothetical protein [Longimicrobiaceae bacterium]
MQNSNDTQEQSICSMYRDGVSLPTLERAFGMGTEEIIRVLHRHGAVQQEPGEGWDEFVDRIRDDVKHQAA